MGSAAARRFPSEGDVVGSLPEPALMSAEEYWAFEQASEWRHEFVNGVVYAMVGGSDRHGLIAGNLLALLLQGLPDRCQPFAQAMKLRIKAARDERYYYPDVLVSCSPDDRASHTRSEPVFIAEVLSRSTGRVDRGEKFEAYRRIPSLEEYALVSQDEVRLELFRRRAGWEREPHGPGDLVRLDGLDFSFPLEALYRRTVLTPSPS